MTQSSDEWRSGENWGDDVYYILCSYHPYLPDIRINANKLDAFIYWLDQQLEGLCSTSQ